MANNVSSHFPPLTPTGQHSADSTPQPSTKTSNGCGASKPTLLIFPMSNTGATLNLNIPRVTKTTTLGQKKMLLATRSTDSRVSIKTGMELADGGHIPHIAIAGVSARMLAAFSGYFRSNLNYNKNQEIYLPTVQKSPFVTLVRWMVNTCALPNLASFHLGTTYVPDLKLLWDTAEFLNIRLAKQILGEQMGTYTRYCSPAEYVELFATFAQSNHTSAIVAMNGSLRPYMMHRRPLAAVQLWKEAMSLPVYDILASTAMLVPRLPGEFTRYLESCGLPELLELWTAINSEQGLEQPQKQTNYHLNVFVRNCDLSVPELEQVFLIDAQAPWTKVAIRRTALRLWWNREAEEDVNNELTPLTDALKAELTAVWDEQNQRWEEKQAKSRATRKEAAPKGKKARKSVEHLEAGLRTLQLGDFMKGSKKRPTL